MCLTTSLARADTVLWRDGEAHGAISDEEIAAEGLAVLDLGEEWAPPLFPEGDPFRAVYTTLAQGRFDDVPDPALAHRARLDRFLESYGIPPTLALLRERMRNLRETRCAVDIQAIRDFGGSDIDEDDVGAWESFAAPQAEQFVLGLLEREQAYDTGELLLSQLSAFERSWLGRAAPLGTWRRGLAAVRDRLRCEGLLGRAAGEGTELDTGTRAALAAFERRHRIYARGRLSGETLQALGVPPLELARRDLVRVLTERARLDWGVIRDGTAGPDALAGIREDMVDSFGLDTPDKAWQWLESLSAADHVLVAVLPSVPRDPAGVIELRVEIDRGDVNYDVPTDAEDIIRVEHRPTLTLFARTASGEWVAMIRWPTTIGGWRVERERGRDVWKYKESPVGPGVWQDMVAAPVWLPPASTPDADLMLERHVEGGEVVSEVKRTILGPGYASAYGLAAAIHRPVGPAGRLEADQGIRTHGSVDYTSVWRRASHGCHRLQNHRAVALFSFLIKHRPHRRVGSRPLRYRRQVRIGANTETLQIDRTGSVFVLTPPVPYEVLPGRIVGRLQRAPRVSVPMD